MNNVKCFFRPRKTARRSGSSSSSSSSSSSICSAAPQAGQIGKEPPIIRCGACKQTCRTHTYTNSYYFCLPSDNQCAAAAPASTLITQKHAPKEEVKQGRRETKLGNNNMLREQALGAMQKLLTVVVHETPRWAARGEGAGRGKIESRARRLLRGCGDYKK